jgi:hypothetical protein
MALLPESVNPSINTNELARTIYTLYYTVYICVHGRRITK